MAQPVTAVVNNSSGRALLIPSQVVGSEIAAPLSICFTDKDGNEYTVTGATVDTFTRAPIPVVLCDSTGRPVNPPITITSNGNNINITSTLTGTRLSAPRAGLLTDANGNPATISGSTVGSFIDNPTSILLCDATGKVVTATFSSDGTVILKGLNPLSLYTFVEGSGRDVFNQVQTQSGSENLILFPEQEFGVFEWTAGAQWTNAFAADPINGFTIATRLNVAAGAAQFLQTTNISAGTYTCSVWAKSNTGANQKFRFNTVSGSNIFSSDVTVTTSWAQYNFTHTYGAAVTKAGFTTDAANEAFDIVVYGFKVEAGSSATAYAPGVLHAKTSYSTPTWSSTGLAFAGVQYAEGTLANHVSSSIFSIYAAVKQSGSPTLAGYRPIVNSTVGGGTPDFVFGTQYQSANRGGVLKVNSTALLAYNAYLNDGNWHVVAAVADGVNMTYYVDGAIVAQAAAVPASISLTGLMLGNLNASANWAGSMGVVAMYPAGHTPTQVSTCTSAIQTIMGSRGVSLTNAQNYWAIEGDSISDPTAGAAPYYYWVSAPNLVPIVPASQAFATSGATLTTLTSRASTVDSRIDPSRRHNILTVLIGRNDMAAGIGSVPAFETALTTYCQARRTAGWKVVISSVLPSTLAGFNAARDSFNTWLSANWTNFADGLADIASDSTMGIDGNGSTTGPWNTTFYSDGTHPTVAGQALLAPYYTTAINTILAT